MILKNDFHYSADIFDIAQDKKSKLQTVSKRTASSIQKKS